MSEESEKKWTSKKVLERNKAAAKVPEDQILEVFEFWKLTFGKKRTSIAHLNHVRRVWIGSAIYHYGIDGAKDAITGCTMSDFHMGRNKQNKTYTGIEHIFKDNARIEAMLDKLPRDQNKKEEPNW
jgi:hypothetical protein